MNPSARWWTFLVVGTALSLSYLGLPRAEQGVLTFVIGTIAIGALLHRSRRETHGRGWAWLAAGVAAFLAGDLVYVVDGLRGVDTPFPSIADVFYVGAYPVLARGLVLIGRANGGRGGLVEALAVALGLAIPLWFLWIAPTVGAGGVASLAGAVSLAYPLGDVVLAGAVVPVVLAAGIRRRPCAGLLALAVALTFVADCIYGVLELNGTYVEGMWLDILWVLAYVAWAGAGLRPQRADDEVATRTGGDGTIRATLLVGAVVSGPAVLAVQALTGTVTDPGWTLAASAVVALLATRGGRDLRRVRPAIGRGTGALVAAPAILLLMGGGLAWLQHSGDRQIETERAVARALNGVHDLRTREREIAATGTVEPYQVRGLIADAAEVQRAVEGLGGTALPSEVARALRLRLGGYVSAGRGVYAEYVAGDAEASARADREVLTPAYDRLHHALEEAGAWTAVRSQRTARVTAVASAATLAVGLLALVFVLLKFGRAQRAATAASALRASEERLAALVAGSSDGIVVVGEDLEVRWQSASVEPVFGYPEGSLVGVPFSDLVHEDDLAAAVAAVRHGDTTPECRVRHADGRWLDVEAAVSDRRHDALLGGFVINLRDVTVRKRLEARLHHQAFHDHLTGLANRALFEDRLAQALRRAERDGRLVGVVFCDLDDFKDVNDTLGHDVGDELLIAVAERIAGEVRGADTLARVGGDEFLLLLDDLAAPGEAEVVADRVLGALRRPLLLGGEEHVVRASVGVAVGGADEDASALLRSADTAMYAAKRQGGSGYQLFADHMGDEVALRLRLRSELELALDREQFVVHYQPIVALGTGAVAGLEALVRWEHPERGLVPPNRFIPLAEQTGLIVPLGAWVLRTACAEVVRWRAELGRPDLYVSVNLAGRQLARPELPQEVSEVLAETGLPPDALLLEVTESSLIEDVEGSARRLEELRAIGVRLAIDDFGTGYSALSYLRRFPMDVLKIDRSFVRGLGENERDEALVDAIVKMSSSLGLSVVAEGIEEEEQRSTLDGLDCGLGQGYLFSRPLPAADLTALLAVPGAPVPA